MPQAPELVGADAGGSSSTDLRFAYGDGAPLFDGLDLSIEPGEHVGLVGPSGSGKTTLTKLLLRFADRDGGVIAIDGQDIAQVTQHSLRRHIAYVPQEPQMLHRTIAENICYGQDSDGVDMELVREVGKAAYVDEFVERLPEGYQTVVGERGLKLSGGQRQRVAIAQAMAKGASVLVLDEATSALDSESESLVQEALWRLMDGTTALVVAHRLATIARLDRIVVLDQGRVRRAGHPRPAVGPHRRLLPLVGAPVGRLPGRLSGAVRGVQAPLRDGRSGGSGEVAARPGHRGARRDRPVAPMGSDGRDAVAQAEERVEAEEAAEQQGDRAGRRPSEAGPGDQLERGERPGRGRSRRSSTTQRTGSSENTVWVTGCPAMVRRSAGFTRSVRTQHHGDDAPDGAERQEEAAPPVGPLAPAQGTPVVRRSGTRPRKCGAG